MRIFGKTTISYTGGLLVLALCMAGFEAPAQDRAARVGDRSFDMHIVFGIHAGPAIMLAPFEYTVSRSELLQPGSPRPAVSFYNAFAGIEFDGNELLFSYGDLPMACGYVIYDQKRNLIYRSDGLVALNSFFALSYKRKLVPMRWKGHPEKGRWSFYVGGYIGMANSPPGLGGLGSSRAVTTLPYRTVYFEFQSTQLIDRTESDYFISFGPEVQARFHWKKILDVFINAGLRITPHVVHAYRMSYNLHQTPDDTFRKAEVRSRIVNVHISFGILFDVQVAKRRKTMIL